jgi:hypothetical protein
MSSWRPALCVNEGWGHSVTYILIISTVTGFCREPSVLGTGLPVNGLENIVQLSIRVVTAVLIARSDVHVTGGREHKVVFPVMLFIDLVKSMTHVKCMTHRLVCLAAASRSQRMPQSQYPAGIKQSHRPSAPM